MAKIEKHEISKAKQLVKSKPENYSFPNPSAAKARELEDGEELEEEVDFASFQEFKNENTGEKQTNVYVHTTERSRVRIDQFTLDVLEKGTKIVVRKGSFVPEGRTEATHFFTFARLAALTGAKSGAGKAVKGA